MENKLQLSHIIHKLWMKKAGERIFAHSRFAPRAFASLFLIKILFEYRQKNPLKYPLQPYTENIRPNSYELNKGDNRSC